MVSPLLEAGFLFVPFGWIGTVDDILVVFRRHRLRAARLFSGGAFQKPRATEGLGGFERRLAPYCESSWQVASATQLQWKQQSLD